MAPASGRGVRRPPGRVRRAQGLVRRGPAQTDTARLRYDTDAAEKARRQDADGRCFDIHKREVSPAGTVPVSGTLDLPDALDYDKPQRQVVVHLHGDTVFGNPNANVGRCDNTRTPLLAETIRARCGNPHATIIVKPVRDLADHIHVAGYEVPDRLIEQDVLVDHHCVFPWCTRPTRPTRSCDCDHAVPHGHGGSTCSCNTAPYAAGTTG